MVRMDGTIPWRETIRTIFVVPLFDFELILALQDNLIVSFIPAGYGSYLRTWKLGQGREIEAVHDLSNGV